eukprot:TRINITY_DN49618_c0_g1_i1.p1 TRINITY_DN49618_c0_g1~~TRINITY_DN49618_c0_g1_i1.p1  ORF type:complete len:858 (+),score=154.57 TRINITY_DN49618_c0_g1_i1:88-2661(+)
MKQSALWVFFTLVVACSVEGNKFNAGKNNGRDASFGFLDQFAEEGHEVIEDLREAFHYGHGVSHLEAKTHAHHKEGPRGSAPRVSTTLKCVMILTIQSMLVYSALAVSRNKDEMQGKVVHSKVTDVLNAASRSSVYSSMLAMLFVGCRMYVLATTKGEGEPYGWVKNCMMLATVGMVLQVCIVLALPLLTEEQERSVSELSGTQSDVHPKLSPHKFIVSDDRTVTFILQIAVMFSIYGGAAGVLLGIYVFPQGETQISAAVVCTCVLSLLYFVVFFLLWLSRTIGDYTRHRTQASEIRRRDFLIHFESGCLSMSMVVRKAPMMAAFFLLARMRALQLDPPNGMPPRWAQQAVYTMTGALAVETLAAGIVGFTHTKKETGYYGIPIFYGKPIFHLFQHASAAAVYANLLPLYRAIYLMKDASTGEIAPLSPTAYSVMIFTALFFAMYMAQTVVAASREFLGAELKVAQDTVLAAGVSVTFVPMLSILFIAVRMRALQVSGQKGGPQPWAQDCMYACVFSTFIQVTCCLVMPLFTNTSPEVDHEGNSTYDLRPMIGAYAVSVIKNVTLLCMHGGVIAICVAVFTMDAENTMQKASMAAYHTAHLKEYFYTFFVVALLALVLSSAKVIGLAIKLGIESADKHVIGTDIHVGKAALAILQGYVNVQGLMIDNPPSSAGKVWKSPCLLKVDRLCVKLNVKKLVSTLGKELELKAIILEGVQVVLEKSYGASSNVGEILNHLESLGIDTSVPLTLPDQPENPFEKVRIGHVSVKDVGASAIIQGAPVHFQVGDLYFDDLQEKLDAKGGTVIAGDLVGMILHTFLKTIMANAQILGAGYKQVKGVGQKIVDTMMADDFVENPAG